MKKYIFCLIVLCLGLASVYAQTSAFSYQGKLTDGQIPANGTYEMQFKLFDAETDSSQVGQTVTNNSVTVTNGVFTVTLDFGANAFPGDERFLEISVKKPEEQDFTTLSPRQPVNSVPYAVRSLNAASVEASTAGNSVINAINDASTNITINENRLPPNLVRVQPSFSQSFMSNDDGRDALINLTGNYTSDSNKFQSLFRANLDGSFLAAGNVDDTLNTIPVEGPGTRLMWYPRKAAFRAGMVEGTQWDETNIGKYSTAFGYNSRASADYGFAAGYEANSSQIGSIALGQNVVASGASSVALGFHAHTNARQGTFVFSDRSVTSDGNETFRASVNNSANWRVASGFRIYTSGNLTTGVTIQNGTSVSNWGQSAAVISTSTGAFLSTGGIWQNASSRKLKDNFTAIDPREILRKVVSLPVQMWNYKVEGTKFRHIGPVSQDFYRIFNVGTSDEAIGTVDADGVALAAIQGLNEELKDRDKKIEQLEKEIKEQKALIEGTKKMLCSQDPQAEICN